MINYMIWLLLKDAASMRVHNVKQWSDSVTPKSCQHYDDDDDSNRMVDYE
jgi:hypothetical protein